jgi:hypothetical protein
MSGIPLWQRFSSRDNHRAAFTPHAHEAPLQNRKDFNLCGVVCCQRGRARV